MKGIKILINILLDILIFVLVIGIAFALYGFIQTKVLKRKQHSQTIHTTAIKLYNFNHIKHAPAAG